MKLVTAIATLDQILGAHSKELGADFAGYRNHAYRVVNLCVALDSGCPETLEKIAIAAAFHDLGIWTDRTFDYLPPSIQLAQAYLRQSGRAEWSAEIKGMIAGHHQITAYRGEPRGLIEPFRRADWVDVSKGVIRFGLPRQLLREIFRTWPNEGFHRRLAQLSLQRLRTHPWSPLPMMRI
jgi:hypothetical protein